MAHDVFLQDVRKAFASFVAVLRPSLRVLLANEDGARPADVQKVAFIIRQLLRLHWRSQDVLSEFAGFYCLRLLLDEQSPLATFFIHLFCELECLLDDLSVAIPEWTSSDFSKGMTPYDFSKGMTPSDFSKGLVTYLNRPYLIFRRVWRPLLKLVRPVANTCRLLYVAYMILPRSERIHDLQKQHKLWRDELQRKGSVQGRKFWTNEMHCRMRELGFTNLDQPGQSMIRLTEKLGEGGFATVYKGVFEAEHAGSDRKRKTIIGSPVAVKMFSSANNGGGGGSNSIFGIRLLQSMVRLMKVDEYTGESSSEFGIKNNLFSSARHVDGGETCVQMEFPSASRGSDVYGGTEFGSGFVIRSATRGNWENDVNGDAQLRDELYRLVSAKHPNIVTPRGYIGKRSQGDSGLVMELMDGSLHDYLEKVKEGSEPPLQELDMLDLMLEITKGMQFLHENKFMHRDLKPKNVLLRFFPDSDLGFKLLEVKIADFGLIKLYEDGRESTWHTTYQGTSCYMAPEIRVRSSTYEAELAYPEKIDVFSFGTTCFNILIGDPDARAFSKSVPAFYEAVRTGEWKEWMQGRIDEHLHYLVKLIGKCWEPDPAMRPTFATLCLLLQNAMRCHVRAAALHDALGASAVTAQASNMQVFMKSCKARRARVYYPIISGYLEEATRTVIGLRVVAKCLHDYKSAVVVDKTSYFESFNKMREILGMELKEVRKQVTKQILLSNLVCNELEEEEDASTTESGDIFQWSTSYNSWDDIEGRRRAEVKDNLTSVPSCAGGPWEMMMESWLDKPDPLICMKGLPCHILAEMYGYRPLMDNSKLQFSYDEIPEFDFTRDEAGFELAVDTSLIPLLVAFWFSTECLNLSSEL